MKTLTQEDFQTGTASSKKDGVKVFGARERILKINHNVSFTIIISSVKHPPYIVITPQMSSFYSTGCTKSIIIAN